jgi:hypothetical protein
MEYLEKKEVLAEIDLLQLKINRIKGVIARGYDTVHIYPVFEGIRFSEPIMQSHLPFNLKQEFNIMLEDSILEYQRMCESLKTLI